jgi:hypothetical protein
MIKQKYIGLAAAAFCISLCLAQTNSAIAQENAMTAKELIAKHLASIGTPENLANVKARSFVGSAMVNFLQGASGSLKDGALLGISEGKHVGLMMKFNDINYPGEYLAYNGKEVSVKDVTPGRKSELANFLFTYNAIMKDGFLGGALSVAWPLLDPAGQEGFLIKKEKIQSRELYALEKNLPNGINVKLFFDPKTFRHVRSEYVVRHKNNIAARSSASIVTGNSDTTATQAAKTMDGMTRPGDLSPRSTMQESEPDTIFKLIEKFSEHAAIGGSEKGLVLPQLYGLELSLEGHGPAFLAQWSMVIVRWTNNGKVDQNFFIAQK